MFAHVATTFLMLTCGLLCCPCLLRKQTKRPHLSLRLCTLVLEFDKGSQRPRRNCETRTIVHIKQSVATILGLASVPALRFNYRHIINAQLLERFAYILSCNDSLAFNVVPNSKAVAFVCSFHFVLQTLEVFARRFAFLPFDVFYITAFEIFSNNQIKNNVGIVKSAVQAAFLQLATLYICAC